MSGTKESARNIDLMRPYDLYEKAKLLRKRDGRRFYAAKRKFFHDVPCVACSSKRFSFKFYKYGFQHVQCLVCGTLMVAPRPSEKDMFEYYSEFEAPAFWTEVLLKTDSERKTLQYAPRAEKLIEICAKRLNRRQSVFLDVGAGAGNFALAVQKRDYFNKIIALDVSNKCKLVCEGKGLDCFKGNLSDYNDKVDCISMNDLIEHVYSPRKLLKDAHKILKRGGILMIATPNAIGFDFMLFGKDTDNITPPEHMQYFNPVSIRTLLERTGFSVLDISTPGILDVQIAERKIKDGYRLRRNKYVEYIVNSDKEIKGNFQAFLQDSKLSSHMLIFATKR